MLFQNSGGKRPAGKYKLLTLLLLVTMAAEACTKVSDNVYYASTVNDAYKLIQNFEIENTLKFSCYKACKNFGETG